MRARAHTHTHTHTQNTQVLGRFAIDLTSRGKVASVEAALSMPRRKLAMMMMDTYIAYPAKGKGLAAFNYCAADALLPALRPVLAMLGC